MDQQSGESEKGEVYGKGIGESEIEEESLNVVYNLITASVGLRMINHPRRGHVKGHVTYIKFLVRRLIIMSIDLYIRMIK